MTGFGQVHPFPGLWPSFHLNTAITLPVGVEAYAAYALRAWLTTSSLSPVTSRCGHVEFGAGFGKRWCACQRGWALLSGSWAGEGAEYGGGLGSGIDESYKTVGFPSGG
jgi:hypothetical protein